MRSLGLLLAALLLSGCVSEAGEPVAQVGESVTPVPTSLRLPSAGAVKVDQVLSLVPDGATSLTITDFDAVRARLGVDDLSSTDPSAERSAFWRQAHREAVLLTDGLLRRHEAALVRDHGFTQDDVDWEAHFSGPDTSGWVLSFRPDLDMARVAAAVEAGVGPLRGATVLPERHLAVRGIAGDDEMVWAQDEALAPLLDDEAEATYLSRECIPFGTALGGAVSEDVRQAVVSAYDVRFLRPLGAFSLTFTDGLATAWFDTGRGDLHGRADLGKVWPRSLGFFDGFGGGLAVADPGTGRIGHQVLDPRAAAALTLAGVLPFAVCNQVPPPA